MYRSRIELVAVFPAIKVNRREDMSSLLFTLIAEQPPWKSPASLPSRPSPTCLVDSRAACFGAWCSRRSVFAFCSSCAQLFVIARCFCSAYDAVTALLLLLDCVAQLHRYCLLTNFKSCYNPHWCCSALFCFSFSLLTHRVLWSFRNGRFLIILRLWCCKGSAVPLSTN